MRLILDPNVSSITGTANQIVVSSPTGAITLSTPQNIHTGASPTFAGETLTGLTLGSIPFAGTGGVISQDNANLFWDDTNNRLGIGRTDPVQALDVIGLRIATTRFSDNALGPGINTFKGRNTLADPRRTKSGDAIGVVNAFGYTAADDATTAEPSTGTAKGLFSFFAAEAFTITGQGTYFSLGTTVIGATTATTGLVVTSRQNILVNSSVTAEPSTGTMGLFFGDGTAPATLAANTAGLYANDDGGTVKMYSIDEAGSIALLNYRNIALGGGGTPTLGATALGGSGPATAAQNSWIEVNVAGTAYWLAAWR